MVAEPKKKAKKAEPLDYDGPVMVVDTSVGEEDVEVADKPESKKPKPGSLISTGRPITRASRCSSTPSRIPK